MVVSYLLLLKKSMVLYQVPYFPVCRRSFGIRDPYNFLTNFGNNLLHHSTYRIRDPVFQMQNKIGKRVLFTWENMVRLVRTFSNYNIDQTLATHNTWKKTRDYTYLMGSLVRIPHVYLEVSFCYQIIVSWR